MNSLDAGFLLEITLVEFMEAILPILGAGIIALTALVLCVIFGLCRSEKRISDAESKVIP
jgi:hypothetical protein